MNQPEITFVVAERFKVGESPVWDAENGRLLWCDIPPGVIHALDPATGARRQWAFGEPVGSFGLCQSGRLVVALRNDIVIFDPATGAREFVAHIEHAKDGMRLNDGKVGPDGAFWIGSMDATGTGDPAGKLYRVAPDGSVRVIADDIQTSNGLAWNADGTRLYHSDSRGMWIDYWRFDATTGAVEDRTRLCTLDETIGRPDGGACDMDGAYWSAGPSSGRLNRFSAEGDLLDWVDLPLARPTMPCFGGPDLRTIYVTSLDSGEATEFRDGIVSFRVPVAGVPVARFARRGARPVAEFSADPI